MFGEFVSMLLYFGLVSGHLLAMKLQHCCCVAESIAIVDSSANHFGGARRKFWRQRGLGIMILEAH